MGGNPSRPAEAAAHDRAVLERLRNLQVEDDYVEVDGHGEKAPFGTLLREAQGLPVHVLESWQSSILKDPKNKSVSPPTSSWAHP